MGGYRVSRRPAELSPSVTKRPSGNADSSAGQSRLLPLGLRWRPAAERRHRRWRLKPAAGEPAAGEPSARARVRVVTRFCSPGCEAATWPVIVPDHRLCGAGGQPLDRTPDRLVHPQVHQDRPPLPHHSDPGRAAHHHRRRPSARRPQGSPRPYSRPTSCTLTCHTKYPRGSHRYRPQPQIPQSQGFHSFFTAQFKVWPSLAHALRRTFPWELQHSEVPSCIESLVSWSARRSWALPR